MTTTASARVSETTKERMVFSEVARVAVDSFRLNKVRFVLIAFGMVVGTASIILVVTIGLTGNASLASAGTGDVLAGWLGGRWSALGTSALEAATRAVIEHGAAAEPRRAGAVRAGDLVEALHRLARGG